MSTGHQQPPIEPRGPGAEVAGNIGIWTTPTGTLKDTGDAVAPGNLSVVGALVLTPAEQTLDAHAATRGWVSQAIQDIQTTGGMVPEPLDAANLYGRKGGSTPVWEATVPLAGGVTMTGALTVPTLTITVALNLPGGEVAASQAFVNSAISSAIGALTILTISDIQTALDERYVQRSGT